MAAAVEAPQVPLGLVPEVLDAIDGVGSIREALGVVDTDMAGGDIQGIAGVEGGGEDNAVGSNLFVDDGQQGLGFRVGNDQSEDFPSPFKQTKDSHLAGRRTASLALARSAKSALAGLHRSGQFVAWQFAGCQGLSLMENLIAVCACAPINSAAALAVTPPTK